MFNRHKTGIHNNSQAGEPVARKKFWFSDESFCSYGLLFFSAALKAEQPNMKRDV